MLVSQTLCWRSAGHPPTPRSTHGRQSVRSAAEICSKLIEIIDSARASGCPPKHRNIGPHPSLLSPFSLLPNSLSLSHTLPPSPFTHPAAGAGWLASWLAGWAAGPPSEPMKTSRSTRAWSSGPRKPPPRAESPPLFASSLSLHLFPLPPFLLLAPTILYLSCVPASPLYALAAPR